MGNSHKWLLISAILILAGFMRLWNLEANPAWYTDEGTHLEIAKHLMQSKTQYLGITDSYLIAARLPLFEHLLALWARLISLSMFSLRLLTSFLGLLSVTLVYRVVKTTSKNEVFAILSMVLFAIYPQAVIYSRFGFSYNLLPPLILFGIYGLLRYQQTASYKYLLLVCLVFGFATLSDFIAFSFLPSIIFIILITQRKHTFVAILLLGLPFGLHVLRELVIHSDIFLLDLTYTLRRTGGLPIVVQIENLSTNFRVLFTETWWIPVGMVGLFFVPQRHFKWMLILFVILPLLISGRTVALYHLSAYYLIPFLPFFVIGVASLFVFMINLLSRIIHINLLYAIIMIGLVICAIDVANDVDSRFDTRIEYFLVSSDEAHHIKEMVIDYAKSDDVILVSPTLAWMFDNHVTDYQLSSLSSGVDGVHFPTELYPDRFAFEVDYRQANYAIVDNLWRDWGAVHMPIVADMLLEIQTNWQLIYKGTTINIYQNPQT